MANGISIAGASGAEAVTLGDAFTVTNSAGSATGIILTDGSSQTVLSGGLNVAGVSATGAQLTNASGAVTFTAGGPLSVEGGSGGTTGIVLADGTDQTTDLAGDLTLNANGGAAVGVLSTGARGAVSVNEREGFNVTNEARKSVVWGKRGEGS